MTRVDHDLLSEWELWRIILKGIATYSELQTNAWSFDDVLKANDVLDIKEAIEAAFMPKLPKTGKV